MAQTGAAGRPITAI